MRITHVMLALAIVASFGVASAQEIGQWERLGIPDPVIIVEWATAIAGLAIVAAVYYKDMGKQAKKILFLIILIPVAIATLYLVVSTIYLNINSSSGGPVHWHADYEIWACGQQYFVIHSSGFDNKVGTPLVHTHNDNRVHIEGVLLHPEDADLGTYFHAIGGEITSTMVKFPTDNGEVSWSNGQTCNGQPARWYMFVNGAPNDEFDKHRFAPYADIPPGDFIKLVFTEKADSQIHTGLFEVP